MLSIASYPGSHFSMTCILRCLAKVSPEISVDSHNVLIWGIRYLRALQKSLRSPSSEKSDSKQIVMKMIHYNLKLHVSFSLGSFVSDENITKEPVAHEDLSNREKKTKILKIS